MCKYDLIIIPVHKVGKPEDPHDPGHWSLVIISAIDKEVAYYDSLPNNVDWVCLEVCFVFCLIVSQEVSSF